MSLSSRDYVRNRPKLSTRHRQYTPQQEEESFDETVKGISVFVICVAGFYAFVKWVYPVLHFVYDALTALASE